MREQRLLKRDAPANATAYEFYLRANQIVARARVWTDAGTWTLARDYYARSLEEDPRFAPAWAGQGRVHRVLAKYIAGENSANLERAESAFKRALELNPELSSAHNLYAQLEIDLGRAREAMVRLIGRARVRGNDPETFVALGTACRYAGLLPASIAARTSVPVVSIRRRPRAWFKPISSWETRHEWWRSRKGLAVSRLWVHRPDCAGGCWPGNGSNCGSAQDGGDGAVTLPRVDRLRAPFH